MYKFENNSLKVSSLLLSTVQPVNICSETKRALSRITTAISITPFLRPRGLSKAACSRRLVSKTKRGSEWCDFRERSEKPREAWVGAQPGPSFPRCSLRFNPLTLKNDW